MELKALVNSCLCAAHGPAYLGSLGKGLLVTRLIDFAWSLVLHLVPLTGHEDTLYCLLAEGRAGEAP